MCVRTCVRGCVHEYARACVRACVRVCVCVVVVVVVVVVAVVVAAVLVNWCVGCNQKQAETEKMTHGYLCSSFIFIIHRENQDSF